MRLGPVLCTVQLCVTMDSCTDTLRLNDKKFFKVIKDSVPKDGKETQNIFEIRDDILYAWNANESCILTLNLGATRGKTGDDVIYQVFVD